MTSSGKETDPTLQMDMFSGALVDNRTRTQKDRDRERAQPQQAEMFAAREVAQFGVNPRPLIPLSEHTRLTLQMEDPRTEEEIARDRQRAAEALTYHLFDEAPADRVTADVAEYVVWQALSDMLLWL